MASITLGGCQQYHLLCGERYRRFRISAALVSNNFTWFKTPGVICTTFFGAQETSNPPKLRWPPEVEVLNEQGLRSHLKKWNSRVRLGQGPCGKSLFPVNIKIRGTTQSRSVWASVQFGQAFHSSKVQ